MSRAARWGLLLLWLTALGGLLAYVITTLRVSTDLRSFMPPARTDEQRLLLEEIGEGPGSRLLLLALSGADPDTLADVSKRLVLMVREDIQFVRALNGDTDLSAIGDSLLPYRYLLSPGFDASLSASQTNTLARAVSYSQD